MKRRLFNLAAAVSLVLCVATAVLWCTSYVTGLSLTQSKGYWVRGGSRTGVLFNTGEFFTRNGILEVTRPTIAMPPRAVIDGQWWSLSRQHQRGTGMARAKLSGALPGVPGVRWVRQSD